MSKAKTCLVLLLMLSLSAAQKGEHTNLNPPSAGSDSSVDMRPILKTSLSLLQQILTAAEHQFEAEDKAAQRRPSVITNSDQVSTYVIKYARDGIEMEHEENEKKNETKGALITSRDLRASSLEDHTTEELKEKWCEDCTTSEKTQTSTQTTEIISTTEFNIDSCTVYEEEPTVENISIFGNWPEVTMEWGLKEDVPEECIREFVARICQRKGACVSGKVAADARYFSVPAQKNITSFYFNASITPVLVNGQSGLERATEYEEINLCPGAAVRNLTWTTTNTSVTFNWLAPDLPTSCLRGSYYLTLRDESGGEHWEILYDTHYTLNDLVPDMIYSGYIRAHHKIGLGTFTTVSVKTDS